jgi:thioredoxin 1
MNSLTDENFKKEILNSQKPILVDFWASWCAPCSALGPILERVASDLGDKVIFAKVNIDEAPVIAQEFNIDRIPNVILFKEGKPVNSFVGIKPEQEIKEWLNQNI